MDLHSFGSVVARWAGPIDFEVVQICGYGPLGPKMPAQPPHNPRTTPLLPMVMGGHMFSNFFVLV
jgi:hypothetical protein